VPSIEHRQEVPIREVDASRHFRWLVRVAIEVSATEVARVADLCAQLGWGLRPDEQTAGLHDKAIRGLLVDVPMNGARRGVCGAAGYRVSRKAGRIGLPVRLRLTTLVEESYHLPTDFPYYRGFAGQQAGAKLDIWRRMWVSTGFRDAGSVPVYPGEQWPAVDRVPDGCFLRRTPPPPPDLERDASSSGGRPFTKTWQAVLVCVAICLVGLVALFLIPPPQGTTRIHAFGVLLLLVYIVAGCWQFVRGRASLAIALAAIPIGLSVLPQFTQMVAEARIDAFLQQFGLSSAYMSYTPGATLSATLHPLALSFGAFGIMVATYGWLRFFGHTQHWFEWVFLFLALLIYTLTAVLVAGQEGQQAGVQAAASARSDGRVPAVYGYSPDIACVTPVSPSVAYEGFSLPTSWATLVFGSSNGQTAVWDPRTGQTTLVSTDDVRITPAGRLLQSCSR
jgi:hypothetical protein